MIYGRTVALTILSEMPVDKIYGPDDHLKDWAAAWKIPNYVAPGIYQVDFDELVQGGVRHVVFDIDNTLVSFGAPKLSSKTIAFIQDLAQRPGIESVRLASNSPRNLSHFREQLGIPVVQPTWSSFKPFKAFYRRILEQLPGANPASVAMIGDKLIQDIWGANAVGITTVLVRPLGRDNFIDTLVRTRPREKRLLRKYLPSHIERWF